MQRRDILIAVTELTTALESTGVLGIVRGESPRDKARDPTSTLRALRDYALLASRFSPAAKVLAAVFKLTILEEPEVWMQLLGGERSNMGMGLARAVGVVKNELPHIVELLQQESVPDATRGAERAGGTVLDVMRITFVEEHGTFSTVARIIEGLSGCQEMYDGFQRLMGEQSVPLAIGAIDSGSDKSFDLFGAAALMKEFKELVISIWGLVVYHRENKLGKRLDLIAAALPILERVNSLEKAEKIGREEAQIIRNAFTDGAKKFVSAGVITDELLSHASYDPRALLSPEPKLLTGPMASADEGAGDTRTEAKPGTGGPSVAQMSDADLERLAAFIAKRTSGDRRPSEGDPEGSDVESDA
jgi:hypothetical protein